MYLPSYISYIPLFLHALSLSTQVSVNARPPPPPSNNLELISPKEGAEYLVGAKIVVQVHILNEGLRKENPKVTISIQQAIQYPQLNVALGDIRVGKLSKGGFKFYFRKQYQAHDGPNRYRIRASWDGEYPGYADSGVFKLSAGE
jgi:hypothetical protein